MKDSVKSTGDHVLNPKNEREWRKHTGLYPEAVRRHRINAYWVQKAKGTEDYQSRIDSFVAALARDLNRDRSEVLEQASLLMSYPIPAIEGAVV